MTRRSSTAQRLLGVGATLTLLAGVAVAANGVEPGIRAATASAPAAAPAKVAKVANVEPAAVPAAALPAATTSQVSAATSTTATSSTTTPTTAQAPHQQAAPAAPAAPRLFAQAAPSYGTRAPIASNVIVPKAGARFLRIYSRSTGTQKLIDLNNPLLAGVPLVLAQEGKARNNRIPVALPVRPNNVVGWVKPADVKIRPDHWRIAIYRAQHRLLLWKDQTLMGSFPVAVGKPSTPTPTGIYYLLVKMTSYGDYGPWLMPTSGFSDVYETFGINGGDAAIAIHGTDEDSSVGHSVSHGCIRMHNRDVSLIAPLLSVGTLVQIH